jgi:hypothetical protein
MYKKGKSSIETAREIRCNPKAVQSLIRRRYNRAGEKHNVGYWTLEETEKLLRGIILLLEIDDIKKCLDKQIPWAKVAEIVGTRGATACEKHFKRVLYWKISVSDNDLGNLLTDSPERKKDVAKIIYFIYKENDHSEEAIDWNLLGSKMPNMQLRTIINIWEELKTKVPANVSGDHREAVAYLVENVLPDCVKVTKQSVIRRLERFYCDG